jgi:1-deoxy-D-xylulose-5-phosphate reductoisomerase
MTEQGLILLGSTGSIGRQTLEVMAFHGLRAAALAAGSNITLLEEQARRFLPELAAVEDEAAGKLLRIALADTPVKVVYGEGAVCEAAALPGADKVLNAVAGLPGLRPSIAAQRAGKRLLLACKEALVAGGPLLDARGIIPVDSEHSAIFRCLQAGREGLSRVILTASGGPWLRMSKAELASVTPQSALRHPVWDMGPKVTADSAFMLNKGLELIEAMRLFGLGPEQVDVVIHPQGVIHSLVEYADGALLAQLGAPDMRVPIQYALLFPALAPCPGKRLDLLQAGALTFLRPDTERFPCLAAAYKAARGAPGAGACFAAAAETAVQAFLQGKLGYFAVAEAIFGALDKCAAGDISSVEDVFALSEQAREYVSGVLP